MKFLWFILAAIAAILMKENSCVPAIRPLSQRGILFPEDNWDDCYLDEYSSRPGVCKKLEECPEMLEKWQQENIYPKTCYFIKKQQFVCCSLAPAKKVSTSTEKLANIFNAITTDATKKPFNIFLDVFNTDATTSTKKSEKKDGSSTSKRPSNIFLDKVVDITTISSKRPSNIFLDNLNTDRTTSRKPPLTIATPIIIFNSENEAAIAKRRNERECESEGQHIFETLPLNGPSSRPNHYPFMAALGWKSAADKNIWYPCGGILISSRFVLTAAHCAELGGESPSFVHLGDQNLTDSEDGTIKIKQFIMHPGSNVTSIYNDIALVELEQEVNNTKACLWNQPDLPLTKLTALGYGHASFDNLSSNQLLKATLIVINQWQCQEYYRLQDTLKTVDIADTHLCAGDVKNIHNQCQGDTGGPLIMELGKVFYVVGITSFGLGCANLPPTIYTRVSSFIDWIEPIVWPEIDIRFDRK